MKACTCDCHNQPITAAVLKRFWSKVEKSENCWNWTGSANWNGYGQFLDQNRRQVAAHRFSYIAAEGEIPEGKIIDHVCRNRKCVNPSHLRTVTHAENVQNQNGHRDSRSGQRGVAWHKASGKWRAAATAGGKTHHGGYFATIEEAAAAARELRLKIHTHNNADRMVTR